MKIKIGLPSILLALLPRSWKRSLAILLALLYFPLLLVITAEALKVLVEPLVPVLWIAGALAVLYGLGRWLLGRRR